MKSGGVISVTFLSAKKHPRDPERNKLKRTGVIVPAAGRTAKRDCRARCRLGIIRAASEINARGT